MVNFNVIVTCLEISYLINKVHVFSLGIISSPSLQRSNMLSRSSIEHKLMFLHIPSTKQLNNLTTCRCSNQFLKQHFIIVPLNSRSIGLVFKGG
ncbi:hypothetical protein CR513_52631, partial [Mucuna pruriens]